MLLNFLRSPWQVFQHMIMCNAQLRVIISRINRTYMLRNISTNMMVKMGRGII